MFLTSSRDGAAESEKYETMSSRARIGSRRVPSTSGERVFSFCGAGKSSRVSWRGSHKRQPSRARQSKRGTACGAARPTHPELEGDVAVPRRVVQLERHPLGEVPGGEEPLEVDEGRAGRLVHRVGELVRDARDLHPRDKGARETVAEVGERGIAERDWQRRPGAARQYDGFGVMRQNGRN